MEITPEIIATKVFKWRKEQHNLLTVGKVNIWAGHTPKERSLCLHSTGHVSALPTFQESEWTGPLLEKAASIGDVEIFQQGLIWRARIWPFGLKYEEALSQTEGVNLNYAIAEAILEAEGE